MRHCTFEHTRISPGEATNWPKCRIFLFLHWQTLPSPASLTPDACANLAQKEDVMVPKNVTNFSRFSSALILAGLLSTPFTAVSQDRTYQEQQAHDRAKAAQDAKDKRHHTTAKVVGGSAVGGAVLGGVMGGGKGAAIGAGVGAGGGYVADKIRKKKGTEKREKEYKQTDPR